MVKKKVNHEQQMAEVVWSIRWTTPAPIFCSFQSRPLMLKEQHTQSCAARNHGDCLTTVAAKTKWYLNLVDAFSVYVDCFMFEMYLTGESPRLYLILHAAEINGIITNLSLPHTDLSTANSAQTWDQKSKLLGLICSRLDIAITCETSWEFNTDNLC